MASQAGSVPGYPPGCVETEVNLFQPFKRRTPGMDRPGVPAINKRLDKRNFPKKWNVMRRRATLIAPLIATVLILSACSGRSATSSSSSTPASGAPAGTGAAPSAGGSATEPGITATSIKLGGTFAQSGTLAIAGQAGDGAAAAVAQINSTGGVDGRKITWVTEDDQYDATLAVTMAKKLIEQEKVFAVEGSVGTPGQLAARTLFTQAKV